MANRTITYLEELEPGDRFRVCGAGSTLVGTLIGLSAGAASVKYDGVNRKVIRDDEGNVTADFEAPNRPTIIARRTEVERVA